MGYKYYVTAKLNGGCIIAGHTAQCKTFIGFLITLIKYRLKYPIVDAQIRNGYKTCDFCEHEGMPCKWEQMKGE